ncbi:BAG family molecular chaperone regulator 6 [Gastrolobium bilobum]|uniref:BAG family molecular chaperone regulator 6 n=1 Tax=Gastrolobium bilobum TaxID=150636 RepID=UPI002AAF706A|nr:BAG family molecular chaperone regulator 6 [Gastrolobium bilobum]
MMPAYRNMDSYPYQRNQTPFPHCYHPGIEAIPPQIKVDSSKSPFSYEQFCPFPHSYGHPIPVNFCCGHNNFPGYYSYRPSYPHAPAPSPSPMYYSGGYPSYGEPFFVPYSPQPHYTMELPKYEYDKCMPRDYHCCGCLNHPCHQKEGKSVKIEEQEPNGGKKMDDALAPVQLKNYHPYPFIWIPPEYTSTPLDMKGVPNMVHDGDGRRNSNWETDSNRRESEDGRMNQKHQSEDKRLEFPFPIIWMPYHNKQEEGGRTNNQERTSAPKCIEEAPHTFKSVPVNSCADEVVTNGTRSNQVESTNTSGSDVIEKVTNKRSIPVKQMELHDQGKNDSEGNDKRERSIPVNQMEDNVTKNDSYTSGQSHSMSTSPRKTSKLPPVCLRVSPLPRKKNGNGSSRSPSPPASKKHSQATDGETSRTPSSGMNDKAQPDLNLQSALNAGEKVKPKERTIQVSENKSSENKGADCKDECQSQINLNMPSGASIGTRESHTNGDQCKTEDKKAEKGTENMTEEATEAREVRDISKPNDEGPKEGRVLLDADAAVLIQAAFRGYQVRKWEPLKKLKQIAEVSKEVNDVRDRIQAFEGSSDLQNNDKQRIAIGETIMRLLLKLDTIQGLHLSLRETRKSLARELTSLQERLDSVMAKKPQQQEQQEGKVAVPGEDSSEGISDGGHDTLEKCQDGVNSVHANDGGSESQPPVDPASNEGTDPIVPPNGLVNEDISQVVTVDALNATSDLSETDKIAEVNDIPIEVENLDMTAWKELPVEAIDEDIIDISSGKDEQNEKGRVEAQITGSTTMMMDRSLPAMVDDAAHDELDSKIHPMKELPGGLLGQDMATSEFETNTSKGEVQAEDVECSAELPVGLLDEDTAESELEKHDETKTYKPTEEGECNADEKTSSSTDDTAKETQREQPLLDEKEEVQSSGESDGWVKIQFQKEDELKGDAPLDIEVGCKSEEEMRNDTKLPSLTTQVNGHELGNGDVSLEANDVNNILPEPMEFVPINDSQKEQEPEEKFAQWETQVDGEDMVTERAISADNKDSQTLTREKTEVFAAPPALKELQLPDAEHDGGLNVDTKLLEENVKLRKMMEKLLEAGNEQLSVISELTGRVKELEKKLGRSKNRRVRTKRYRPATSKMSCMKSSN